jgi:hypothetical protein
VARLCKINPFSNNQIRFLNHRVVGFIRVRLINSEVVGTMLITMTHIVAVKVELNQLTERA